MKVAIVADSNSGITKSIAQEMGIFSVPMPVMIDGETFYEGVDIDSETFYTSMTSGKNVTTAQPSPGDVLQLWDEILADGYDSIVYIPMSSGLSGSCGSAMALSADYDGKVQVVDNHRVSVTQKHSVFDAIRLAKEGLSAVEIRKALEANAYQSSIYVAVDTLEFLKKGGRVTAAAAAIGTVLNLKPVLSIQGEKLDAYAKVRGMKKAQRTMLEAVQKDIDTRFADVPKEQLRIGVASTALDPSISQMWIDYVHEAFPDYDMFYDPLSFSIGAHVGPNALGLGISQAN